MVDVAVWRTGDDAAVSYRLRLKVVKGVCVGAAMLWPGRRQSGSPFIDLPAWGTIAPVARRRCLMSAGQIWLILVVVLFGALTVASALIYVERRLLALFQDRYGPNRVGPFGLLQLPADMIKLFFKQDWLPPFADRRLFVLAPIIVILTALSSFGVLVFLPGVAVADLNVGLLFLLGMSSLGVYSVALAGWSSNNKYSLLGGLRAVAQTISYEAFMGLALAGVVIQTRSLSLGDIIRAKEHLWNVVPQAAGFLIFLAAGMAELRRLPFDLPEAENELVAGYHVEYSGMKFAMFFFGEYIGLVLVSSVIAMVYFGGYWGPWVHRLPALGVVWYLLKTAFFIGFFILVRGSLPRPRYDQVMSWAWKLMLPLALVNVMATGAVVLAWK